LEAKLERGLQLRGAGNNSEALAVWDEVLATGLEDVGQDVKLAVAETMSHKAFVLSELGQAPQAEALAERAVELVASIDLPHAQVVEVWAAGLRASLVLDRGDAELAIKLDEQVAAKFAGSTSAEVRLRAGRCLHHAVWIHIEQRDPARAIAAARQLGEILCHPLEASEVIQATEVLLSCADTLSAQSAWRRPPAELRAQAQLMIDTVVEMANHTGGEARAAVTISAQIVESDLRGREHRLRAAYKTSLKRPLVSENELPALQQVQEAAQDSGARFRAQRLLIVRAESLSRLGRTNEALTLLDDALARLDATPGTTARGDAFFVRAARKAIAG
jgi:tetratricopeptide (TPR) repeat protein